VPYAGRAEIAVFVTSCEARGTARLAFRPARPQQAKLSEASYPFLVKIV